jgi:hypothetical protein
LLWLVRAGYTSDILKSTEWTKKYRKWLVSH